MLLSIPVNTMNHGASQLYMDTFNGRVFPEEREWGEILFAYALIADLREASALRVHFTLILPDYFRSTMMIGGTIPKGATNYSY